MREALFFYRNKRHNNKERLRKGIKKAAPGKGTAYGTA
jgi:hypothetical protein